MESNLPLSEETAKISKEYLEKSFKAVRVHMREQLMKETLAITTTAVVAAEEAAQTAAFVAASS